jgi:ATP synthase subunit 6
MKNSFLMLYNKPLEQFTVKTIYNKEILPKYFLSINSLDLMHFFFIIISFILFLNTKVFTIQKRTLGFIQPYVHKFFKNIIISQLSFTGEMYFVSIACIFFTILVYNLLGILPGFFCATAQLGVPLSLSFSVFFGTLYFILYNCDIIYFFNLFIPRGVTKVLIPIIFVLEVISFLSRALSLAIRLFANMVAGHSLLHILAGALLSIGASLKKLDNIIYLVLVIPFVIILLVYFLEFGIAFLQAYVFVMLSLVYLKDTLIYVPKNTKLSYYIRTKLLNNNN